MTARWPLELPQYPLREGLDVEPLDTDVRGETDTGPGTVRAAELGEWNKVRCTVALRSRDERDRLLQWHRDDLVGGTQEFDWPELDASVGDLSYRYIFTAKPKRVPRGVQGWRMALELMTLPAPPPVGFVRDGALGDYIATVTRPAPVIYYAADLSKQTAAVDASAIDYDPVDGRRRGQRLNSGDYIDCSLVALDEEGGTLRYTEEPMTTADRTVHEIRDDSGSSAVRLAVANGRYVFTVVNAGMVVAALDTGVAPAIFQRKQIVCAYSRDRIIAIASGGEAVVATGGNIPPVDTLTRWRVGGAAATPGQCWVVDFDYIGRAEQRPAAGAVDVIRDELLLVGDNYLSPYASFTRNTEATYWDANRVLRTAAIDEPRFDHDPVTGEYRGLLVEQAGENRLWNSRNLRGAGWVARGAPVQADGDWFVVSLGPPDAGNVSGIVQAGRSAGAGVSWAIVAPGNVSGCLFTMGDSITVRLAFDIRTLDVSYISPHIDGYGMTPLPGGACFVWVYADGTGYPSDRSSGISINPIGNEGDTLRVFAAQHEPNVTRPSSLIITADSGATRARDNARFPDLTPFNEFREGTFVVEFETQSAPNTINLILSRGGSGRFAYLNSAGKVATYDGTTYAGAADGLGDGLIGTHKLGVTWGASQRVECLDGNDVSRTPWSGTWGSSDPIIGEANWSGWIKPLRWIPRRVSDAEPQQLTQNDRGSR